MTHYNIARVLALYKSYWAARPCVNKMTCLAMFLVPFPKYPKIDGNDKKLSRLFLEFSFVLATQSNSKVVTYFANNRAWMIRWNLKVCGKDWHLLGKRPQIGLCRKISNLYKVSSVFNIQKIGEQEGGSWKIFFSECFNIKKNCSGINTVERIQIYYKLPFRFKITFDDKKIFVATKRNFKNYYKRLLFF